MKNLLQPLKIALMMIGGVLYCAWVFAGEAGRPTMYMFLAIAFPAVIIGGGIWYNIAAGKKPRRKSKKRG